MGPKTIISNPPLRKFFCSIIPVENAIALDGVETGSSSAQEQLSATISGTAKPQIPGKANPKGTRMDDAAVLLMIFEIRTAIIAKTIPTPKRGIGRRSILSMMMSVNPTSTIAIPKARPPATSIKVSHGSLRTSSALMIWNNVNKTIGMAEVAAMGIL